jgi:4-amino-4-deoxy-L-arabinose transferase-like glycosyltransferase
MASTGIVRRQAPLLVLLVSAATVFCWRLDVSGYANAYYSAAAQAGSASWKALFFGSLDAGNGITVDKPPLALWPMGVSARVFGLSSWSVLLPQAIEGVASVGLLYACVRRTTGQIWVGVLAGALFALTPVSVLVFRYNIPDAMLTLLLLGAAYATLRALEGGREVWWLVAVGTLSGLGFLTKMLEAWVVLPALWLTYLVYGRGTLARRCGRLALSGLATVAAAGWWVAVVEAWPAGDRPFIGGSPTNSILQLAIGYNGIGRMTGSTGTTANAGGFGATNIARIGRVDLGAEIMWLFPAALGLGVLAWWLSRRHPAQRSIRSALFMWSAWLAVVSVTFAAMAGIFHSYYTVILAPAIAALVATGTWVAWENRESVRVRWYLVAVVGVTTLVSGSTVAFLGFELRWFFLAVVAAGVAAMILVHPPSSGRALTVRTGVVAVIASLVGPALFSYATVRAGHVGSGPMAGPGRAANTTEPVAPSALGGSFFGADVPIPDAVVTTLAADSGEYRWAAATLGAEAAAAYQLRVGAPVLAIGGYKGTDPLPTLDEFIAMVQDRQIHWFIPGGIHGLEGTRIETWVRTHVESTTVAGYILYNLDRPTAAVTPPPQVLTAGGAVP